MKRYVVYDNTGRILKYGVCPNIDLELQASKTGEKVAEVSMIKQGMDITHKIATISGELKLVETNKM